MADGFVNLIRLQSEDRIFQTSFESSSEFASFYSVPSPYQSVATHGQSTEQKPTGTYSHKASILGLGPTCFYLQNCNHRGYPTIQLNKLPSGGFKPTVLGEYYVYNDDLRIEEVTSCP